MDDRSELHLPPVHREETALPGGVWNGPGPRAPAGAPCFLPGAAGEVGLGHFVLPPARTCRLGRSGKLVWAAWPFPLWGRSPERPRLGQWAHVVHRDPARDARPCASPRSSPARAMLAGRGTVGDWAPRLADPAPTWQTNPSRYRSQPSPGSAFGTDTDRGTPGPASSVS